MADFTSLLRAEPFKIPTQVKKYNPHHEPAGSSKGGQFAKKPMGIAEPNATYGQGSFDFGKSKLAPRQSREPSLNPADVFTAQEMSLPKSTTQPWNTEEGLIAAATEGQTLFKQWLDMGTGKAISLFNAREMTTAPETTTEAEWNQPGAMLFIAPPKHASGTTRFHEKIEGELEGKPERLLDPVRGTIVFDTVAEVEAAYKLLRMNGLVAARRPKHRFADPPGTQYGDIMVNTQLSNGLIAEVQLSTKNMMIAKNRGHKSYEVTRHLEEKYGIKRKPLPPLSIQKWPADEREAYVKHYRIQQKLYAEARKKDGLPAVPIDITDMRGLYTTGKAEGSIRSFVQACMRRRYYDHDNAIYMAEPGTPLGGVSHVWFPVKKQWVACSNPDAAKFGKEISKEEAEV